MVSDELVCELMLEAVLNSRYITDEEAEEWVNNRANEMVEAINDFADEYLADLLANG